MPFKKVSHSDISAETPEALFRDLRNRQVQGLLSHQADLLREYCKSEFLDSADVALQLPTGSGKTLIGLLIAEWQRRKFDKKVVYLCPTRQLVHQVVNQSINQYGIKANAFTGSQSNYFPNIKSEYINSETIAVTTYSALFNTNSFFKDSDILIFDDAHSSENYIAKYWSLSIERYNPKHKTLYDNLITVLDKAISQSHKSRIISEDDSTWVEKVPSPILSDLIPELVQLLDENIKQTSDLQYPWSVLRDHLCACNIYITSRNILIRPVIPPTHTHKPFANVKQRIYMSATLGEGGELERITGVEKMSRLPIPQGWQKQGDGRRLFLFPERSHSEKDTQNIVMSMIKSTERTLVLVPDERTEQKFKKSVEKIGNYKTFNASEIEKSKECFVKESKAVAVVANRYDGIDLPDNECRLLVVNGLQQAVNLQERFLVTRMPAAILYRDRILTRTIQAVGRCTRSATDYAAVIILGQELNNFFLTKEKRSLLHPEIQAEVEFGIEQSKNTTEEDYPDYFRMLLEHQDEWNDAETEILSMRNNCEQKELPGIDKLRDSAPHEVKYQRAMWKGDFEGAVAECRKILSYLSGDEVIGYRAFWYYLSGSAAWMGAKQGASSLERVARDYFKRAFDTAQDGGIPWLYELSRLNLVEQEEDQRNISRTSLVIEGLEEQLSKLGTVNDSKFEKEVNFILDNLTKSHPDDSKIFEQAHERLGRLLGFQAGNDESTASPDPWWIAGDDFCIVFEDHSSEATSDIDDKFIGANKVRQAASHPKWIKSKNMVSNKAVIIPVMITPYKKIDKDAVTYAEDVCYWHKDHFYSWSRKAIAVIRSLRRIFPNEADLEWRKEATQKYLDNGLDPASLMNMLQNQLLSNLPTN